MKHLATRDSGFERQFGELLARDPEDLTGIDSVVDAILTDIRVRGDSALMEYTRRYDRVQVDRAAELEIPRAELELAPGKIDKTLLEALEFAARRIREFHERQLRRDWSFTDDTGAVLGQRFLPLDRAGVYVPGGKASYPSSVLMTAVTARVAGVREVIMAVPATDGQISPSVLAAAAIAGVDRVFRIGGAQAIAALAWGTQTVPRVDKIVGPGNAYVAAAKRKVFGEVGIDMIAGPSEVLIVSDAGTDPDWVAMDLFAQAEHDEQAQSIHMTTDPDHHRAVADSVARLLPGMHRRQIIEAALDTHGALVLTSSTREVIELINRVAPEHLELLVEDADSILDGVRHAGAIFIGRYSAEALGDYCAGPNHVLPTSGTARFSSPLGVQDFQKYSSVIRFPAGGQDAVARAAAVIAEAEGLYAHMASALYRCQPENNA